MILTKSTTRLFNTVSTAGDFFCCRKSKSIYVVDAKSLISSLAQLLVFINRSCKLTRLPGIVCLNCIWFDTTYFTSFGICGSKSGVDRIMVHFPFCVQRDVEVVHDFFPILIVLGILVLIKPSIPFSEHLVSRFFSVPSGEKSSRVYDTGYPVMVLSVLRPPNQAPGEIQRIRHGIDFIQYHMTLFTDQFSRGRSPEKMFY